MVHSPCSWLFPVLSALPSAPQSLCESPSPKNCSFSYASMFKFYVPIFSQKPQKPLSDKETLVRVLTPLVAILLVCKHPDSLTTNTVIPFRDSFSERKNIASLKNRLRIAYFSMTGTELFFRLEKPVFLLFQRTPDAPRQNESKLSSALGFLGFSFCGL